MKTSKLVPIQYTKDLKVFLAHPCNPGNRGSGDSKFKELLQSMAQYGFDPNHPIQVSKYPKKPGYFVVFRGHRRLAAAEVVDCGVYYQVVEVKDPMNPVHLWVCDPTAKPWTAKEAAMARFANGDTECGYLLQWCEAKGYGVFAAVYLLSGGKKDKEVLAGTFEVRTERLANTVAKVASAAVESGYAHAKGYTWSTALALILKTGKVTPERLIERFKSNGYNIKATNRLGIIEGVQEMCNYHVPANAKAYFLDDCKALNTKSQSKKVKAQ